MSYTTNESKHGLLSEDQMESPDDGICGESSIGRVVLKKGPWTSAEDAILIDYIKKHGEGNWNAAKKHLGAAPLWEKLPITLGKSPEAKLEERGIYSRRRAVDHRTPCKDGC